MFPTIEFNEAAFKHGITEANIRHAMWRPLHEELLETYTNKWLVIGYDTVGNLLEIAYRAPLKTSVRFLEVPGRKPQLFVI